MPPPLSTCGDDSDDDIRRNNLANQLNGEIGLAIARQVELQFAGPGDIVKAQQRLSGLAAEGADEIQRQVASDKGTEG